jgi:hypothetical protein
MSDRTAFQITILACPEDEREAAAAVLNEYGLGEEWGIGNPYVEELEPGTQYVDDQASVGITYELPGKLIEAAPGATWHGHEDPRYEWLGTLAMYTPELGLYTHDCDAQGNPVFAVQEVRAMLADPDQADRLLGKPWDDAIAALLPEEVTA